MSKRRNSEEASLVCPYASCGYSIKSVQDGRWTAATDGEYSAGFSGQTSERSHSRAVTPMVEPPVGLPITPYEGGASLQLQQITSGS